MKRVFVASFIVLSSFCYGQESERETPRNVTLERIFNDGMRFYITEEFSKSLIEFEKALAFDDKNATILYMIAKVQQKLNNPLTSLKFAEKSYLFDSSNKYYALLLIEHYLSIKNTDKAIKIYQDLVLKYPKETDFSYQLAALYVTVGHLDKALLLYKNVEKKTIITKKLRLLKQQLYFKQGKIEEAIQEGKTLIKEYPGDPDSHIQLAQHLINHNRSEESIPFIESAQILAPYSIEGYIILAGIYREKDKKRAIKVLKNALAIENTDIKQKIWALQLFKELVETPEEKTELVQIMEHLMAAHPKNIPLLLFKSTIVPPKNEKIELQQIYSKLVKIDPARYGTWTELLKIEFELNWIDSAFVHSEKSIEIFPNEVQFWYWKGVASQQLGKYPQAEEAFLEAKNIAESTSNPSLLFFIYSNLGELYNSIRQYEKSDEYFDLALKLNPEENHLLNNYSYFLAMRKQNLEKATEMAKRLVSKEPTNSSFLDTYSFVQYQRKNYNEALRFSKKAIEFSSKTNMGLIYEHYGDILFRLNEVNEAVVAWEKARSLGIKSLDLGKKIVDKKLYE